MSESVPTRSPAQERQLRQAASAAREGVPIPWDTSSHRARCDICNGADRAELEARFLSWEPTKHLAEAYGVSVAVIEDHAACFLLHLRRCGELAPAYSRLVEAGVCAAERGEATPDHALKALKALAGPAPGGAPPGAGGTAELLEDGRGQVVLSYEEKVRRVRAALTAGDPEELRAVVAEIGGGQADQVALELPPAAAAEPAPGPPGGAGAASPAPAAAGDPTRSSTSSTSSDGGNGQVAAAGRGQAPPRPGGVERFLDLLSKTGPSASPSGTPKK